MSINNRSKINNLLKVWPTGTVCLSSYLSSDYGVSGQLLDRYKKSNWLKSIGSGAVIRDGDKVDYLGGLYALQNQANLSIHVGGRTALSLLGRGQYLNFSEGRVVLIGGKKEKLPLWFKKKNWAAKIDFHSTSFLPPDLGLTDLSQGSFFVKISSPTRAILECLYLTPNHQELFECYELMEGLYNLDPKSVQELLENCSSVKVKRLFLYLAEKLDHPWLEFLEKSKINLGSGNRSLVKNGIYVAKYKITVPEELERNEQPRI
jgi:hypothetical protein